MSTADGLADKSRHLLRPCRLSAALSRTVERHVTMLPSWRITVTSTDNYWVKAATKGHALHEATKRPGYPSKPDTVKIIKEA